MVDTPFRTWLIKPTGATHGMNTPDRFARIVDVKDYGATGDGVTDDTAAIQAAFDAAWGSYNDPHANDSKLNRPVYLSPGSYNLTSRGSATVTACAQGSANPAGGFYCKLTLSAPLAAAFGELDPVLVTGVNGNANVSTFIHILDSTHVELLGTQFTVTTVSGPSPTMKLPCLKIRSLQSGKLYGAGRFASGFGTADTNCAIISTNGCAYSEFRDFGLFFGAGGIGFDLSWNNPAAAAASGDTVSLQSVKFEGLYVAWTGSFNYPPLGKWGISIGSGQNQGDTILIENCYFSGCDAGVVTQNGNAASIQVIGGNMAANNYGIYTPSGSVSNILGVNFQQQQIADIHLSYSAGENCTISGCRDENGAGFLITGTEILRVNVDNCSFLQAGGWFHTGHAKVTITGCTIGGDGFDDGGDLIIQNCGLTDTSFFTNGSQRFTSLYVFPQIVTTITAATYTIQGADASSRIIFNRATGQTITVPKSQKGLGGLWLDPGAKIEVQQSGDGQVTFIAGSGATINSSNGLKLRTKYSCATLILTSDTTWTLTGDTAT